MLTYINKGQAERCRRASYHEGGEGAGPVQDRRLGEQQVRVSGVDGTGIEEFMHAAGLTHGGFYNHFVYKNDLAVEAYGTPSPHRRPSSPAPSSARPLARRRLSRR